MTGAASVIDAREDVDAVDARRMHHRGELVSTEKRRDATRRRRVGAQRRRGMKDDTAIVINSAPVLDELDELRRGGGTKYASPRSPCKNGEDVTQRLDEGEEVVDYGKDAANIARRARGSRIYCTK